MCFQPHNNTWHVVPTSMDEEVQEQMGASVGVSISRDRAKGPKMETSENTDQNVMHSSLSLHPLALEISGGKEKSAVMGSCSI